MTPGTFVSMRENDWTRVLGWPGYKVYRAEIDELAKRLKLWVRRKRCGANAETSNWSVRDAVNW